MSESTFDMRDPQYSAITAVDDGRQLTREQLKAALDHARREGAAEAFEHPPASDPMVGAIDRLVELTKVGHNDQIRLDCGVPQGWHVLRRMVGLALNEAYRNGMRGGEQERPAPQIAVWIPGLTNSLQSPGQRGGELSDWSAVLRANMTSRSNWPVYELLGDPNAVAVGRFKASLRKFLGVD